MSQRSVDQISRALPVYRDGDIRPLLSSCDVLLTWAIPDLAGLIGNFPGRVVAISHGDGQWLRSRLHDSFDRATDFVAVSCEAANAFPEPIRDRVVIQPAGIEVDRISPSRSRDEVRKDWGVRPDQIALGYVGRFSPEKNPLQLARIVAGMDKKYVAVYHGHNPWGEEEFRREATEIAKGRIVFVPPAVHTGDVYAGIDRLIQASEAEGGPLVALEAWLTNTPLVTTNVGVIADDDDLRACSEVVPSGSSVDRWRWAVRSESRHDTHSLSIERYSAAAASRRWEDYLIKLRF
ncbi:MAG: glycosyltransferase family 4 protein [Planctomycetes bacterium]|nr:glycosyltransferase family 4 protein [Planctomycetota bacterium]